MMRAKGVDLEPEENTYQEGSVFGKRFGNAGRRVTAAVVECFKGDERGYHPERNEVQRCGRV